MGSGSGSGSLWPFWGLVWRQIVDLKSQPRQQDGLCPQCSVSVLVKESVRDNSLLTALDWTSNKVQCRGDRWRVGKGRGIKSNRDIRLDKAVTKNNKTPAACSAGRAIYCLVP